MKLWRSTSPLQNIYKAKQGTNKTSTTLLLSFQLKALSYLWTYRPDTHVAQGKLSSFNRLITKDQRELCPPTHKLTKVSSAIIGLLALK